MDHAPDISVVIPTRNRAGSLTACLAALSRQTLERGRYEVVVVLDGPDEEAARACAGFASALPLRIVPADRLGNANAKNAGLAAAAGRWIVFLNDDVIPAERLLEAHRRAHQETAADAPAMILGYSPFAVPAEGETLFDRLVRDTSMVFFYDRMIDGSGRPKAPPEHDWGFRHAWTLNLSVARDAVAAVGGFNPALANCCYEDLELAWRLARHRGMPILFRPGALAPHHHRFTPDSYLEREFRLGYSAYGLALLAPACGRETFGRDLADPRELAETRRAVDRVAEDEPAMLSAFHDLARSHAPSGPTVPSLESLYLSHLPLKRLWFRRGLLAAWAGERIPGLFHPSEGLAGGRWAGLAAA